MDDHRACDLCGGISFELLSDRDRRGRALATEVCTTCGLVSHAKIPSADELAAYYAREYRRDYHNEFSPSPHRVVREWQRGERLVKQLSPDLREGEKIFSIGAGMGCNVMNFVIAGFDASGIEPGDDFRNFSVQKLHARIEGGFLEDVPRLQQYDVVLLVHVLEHLPSPTAALSHIRGLLRAGGRLYVEVPNFARPHAAPGKQFHFAHIYNFTPATLRMVAAKSGFAVRHAYTAPFDHNICFLLELDEQASFRVEPQSYSQSMAAVRRYSTLTYHLRWEYLRERWKNAVAHFSERWQAKARMEKIIQRCDALVPPPAKEITPRRRVA